jgi:hypothetical protein
MLKQQEKCNSVSAKEKVYGGTEGLVDKEALMTFDAMFDNENELTD